MQQGACAGTQEPEAGRENFVNFSSGLEVKFLWKCLQKEEDLLTGTSNQTSHHHLTELLDSSGPEYHWEWLTLPVWSSERTIWGRITQLEQNFSLDTVLQGHTERDKQHVGLSHLSTDSEVPVWVNPEMCKKRVQPLASMIQSS
ncbi:uncharacterized protein LOC119959604 isoform X2 [Scyliorhinus canicula]|uniref:uncharacterized protein LOC119959604 isoform X2 n=1 Tax=Scyliorhinus canicula TaxID=7830 RepID=UPI0018F670DA|nr:uncharacterized protein LOC119959604 isoform X2 [Scyliorhinus canicula]